MFHFYNFIYSKVVLTLSFLLLLNINAILKKVENQTVAGPQCSLYCQSQCGQQLFGFPHSSKYLLTDVNVCGAEQYIDTARPAADRMCAVARYNNISSKTDRGDIFIRTAAGQMGCAFIVVPPSLKYYGSKK